MKPGEKGLGFLGGVWGFMASNMLLHRVELNGALGIYGECTWRELIVIIYGYFQKCPLSFKVGA